MKPNQNVPPAAPANPSMPEEKSEPAPNQPSAQVIIPKKRTFPKALMAVIFFEAYGRVINGNSREVGKLFKDMLRGGGFRAIDNAIPSPKENKTAYAENKNEKNYSHQGLGKSTLFRDNDLGRWLVGGGLRFLLRHRGVSGSRGGHVLVWLHDAIVSYRHGEAEQGTAKSGDSREWPAAHYCWGGYGKNHGYHRAGSPFG